MSERYESHPSNREVLTGIYDTGKVMDYGGIVDKLNRTAELETFAAEVWQNKQSPSELHDRAAQLLDEPSLAHGMYDAELAKTKQRNAELEGEVAFLRSVGSLIDSQFGKGSYKAAQKLAKLEAAFAPVNDWYESDEHEPRPLAEKLTDAVTDLQNDRQQNLKLIKMLRRIQKQSEYIDLLETEEEDSDDKDSEEIEAAKYDWAMIMGDIEELLNQTQVEPEANAKPHPLTESTFENHMAGLPDAPAKVCVWTEKPCEVNGATYTYTTQCGGEFSIDLFDENNCPNCGGHIASKCA